MRISTRKGLEDVAGATLIEMAVVVAIFTLAMSVVFQLIDQTGTAVGQSLRSADLDGTMRRVVDRMLEDLKDSGSDTDGTNYVTSHPFDVATESQTLTFRRRVAFTGDPTDWGEEISYSLAQSGEEIPGNARDDDGDGVVDEQLVVRSQGGEVVAIGDGVTAFSVRRLAGEYKLDCNFTFSRVVERGEDAAVRAVLATIALRNKP